MKRKQIEYTLQDLEAVANKVLDFADEDNIILFEGDLGAGKTTLINLIAGLD